MGPIGLLNAFVSFLLVLTTAKAASLRRREAEPEPVGMDVLLPPAVEAAVSEIEAAVSEIEATEEEPNVTDLVEKSLTDFFSSNESSIVKVLQDSNLGRAQVFVVINRVYSLLPRRRDPISSLLPPPLLAGLPFNKVFQVFVHGKRKKTLIALVPTMAPAQETAIYLGATEGSGSLSNLFDVHMELPAETSLLLRYVGPEEFKAADGVALSGSPSSESEVAVSLFPPVLRRALLEKHLDSFDLTLATLDTHPWFAEALTCSEVQGFAPEVAIEWIKKHREHRARYHPMTPYPLALRRCFAEKVLALIDDNTEDNDDSETGRPLPLSYDQIQTIGGHVLSLPALSLRLLDDQFDSAGKGMVLTEIGKTPPYDVVTLMSHSHAKWLAEKGEKVWKKGDMNFSDLGSLIHFGSHMLSSLTPGELVVLMESFGAHTSPCLTEEARTNWKAALDRWAGYLGEDSADQTLATMTDLLIAVGEDWIHLNLDALAESSRDLIDRSRLQAHFTKAPAYTPSTKMAQACRVWLGGTEGEKFYTAFQDLMRLYLKGLQSMIDTQPLIGRSRRRRQAGGEESEVQIFMFKVQNILRDRFEAGQIDEETRKKIRETIASTRAASAQLVKERLEMDEIPPSDKLQDIISDYVLSNKITRNEANRLVDEVSIFLKSMAVEVARLLELKPEDVGESLAEFCSFSAELCPPEESENNSSIVLEDQPAEAAATPEAPTTPETATTTVASTTATDAVADSGVEGDEFGGAVDLFSPEDRLDPVEPIEQLSEEFTCEGLKEAGSAAEVLVADDFANWSPKELLNCLEVFGQVDWPIETKIGVWNLLKEKGLPLTTVSHILPRHMLLLNKLLMAVLEVDLAQVNALDSHLDGLSQMGEMPLPTKAVTELAALVKESFKLPRSEVLLNSEVYGSLGHFLCGFEPDDLETAMGDNSTASIVLAVAGDLQNCSNPEVLKTMANSAIKLYGPPSTWTASLVSHLGLVVSGLSPEDLASIGECCVDAISPRAMQYLSFDHLNAVPSEKLRLWAPETLATMTPTHVRASSADDDEEEEELQELEDLSEVVAVVTHHFEDQMLQQLRKEEVDVQLAATESSCSRNKMNSLVIVISLIQLFKVLS